MKNLRCQYLMDPVGIDAANPLLSWQAGASNQEWVVQVAKSPFFDRTELLWEAKIEQTQVVYAGEKLAPFKRYFWRVREEGNPSVWSDVSHWVTGTLSLKDWGNAGWIAMEPPASRTVPGLFFKRMPEDFDKKVGRDPLPQFRRSLEIQKEVKQATLIVSGLGHYTCYLNGTPCDASILTPAWSNYDKTIFYNGFDLTERLAVGENCLAVILGNGMYNVPNERYFMFTGSYGNPRLLLKLVVEYQDGDRMEIDSNDTWKVTESAVEYSSIFGGEDVDLSKEIVGWKLPGFDDSEWKQSIIIDRPDDRLKFQYQPSIYVQSEHHPVSIRELERGTYIVDLGKNFAGIPWLEVDSIAPSEIKVEAAELLDDKGDLWTKNMWGDHYYHLKTSGNGCEKWQPQFTYYGFRFLKIEGVTMEVSTDDVLPRLVQVSGKEIHTHLAKTGGVHTSNDLLNQVRDLILNAMTSNLSHVMTDCPHREKLGWLEQAHMMAPSYMFTFDSLHYFKKIIGDMVDAQCEDGLIPCIAPEYTQFSQPYRQSPEWGGAMILLPWEVYMFYGDSDSLRNSYDAMKRYLDFLTSKAENHLLSIGIGDWMDLGPEPPGPSQLTPTDLVDTVLYYQCASTLSKVAKVLHKNEDETRYSELAESIKTAYNQTYFNEEECTYGTGSQTSLAMSLDQGLVLDIHREVVFQRLVDKITSQDFQLTSGDIGHRYLLRTLANHGRSDLIMKMHLNPEKPSYAYQLAQGATTLTESWQADRMASHNHCMLGHLMEWYYRDLAGIQQQEGTTGFEKLIIKPYLKADVSEVNAHFDSPKGRLKVHWKKQGTDFSMTVTIPAQTEAVIELPIMETKSDLLGKKLHMGEYRVEGRLKSSSGF